MILLSRFREALQAGRDAVANSDPRGIPDDAPTVPDVPAVLALGAECETAEVRAAMRKHGKIAFLITASRDLAQYQTPGLTTEFLPFADADGSTPPDSARLLYAARRLGMICEKWRLGSLHPVGPATAGWLGAMRAFNTRLPPEGNQVRLR